MENLASARPVIAVLATTIVLVSLTSCELVTKPDGKADESPEILGVTPQTGTPEPPSELLPPKPSPPPPGDPGPTKSCEPADEESTENFQCFRFVPATLGKCVEVAETFRKAFQSASGATTTAECVEFSPEASKKPWYSIRLDFDRPVAIVNLQAHTGKSDAYKDEMMMYGSSEECQQDLDVRATEFKAKTGLNPIIRYCYETTNPNVRGKSQDSADGEGWSDTRIVAVGTTSTPISWRAIPIGPYLPYSDDLERQFGYWNPEVQVRSTASPGIWHQYKENHINLRAYAVLPTIKAHVWHLASSGDSNAAVNLEFAKDAVRAEFSKISKPLIAMVGAGVILDGGYLILLSEGDSDPFTIDDSSYTSATILQCLADLATARQSDLAIVGGFCRSSSDGKTRQYRIRKKAIHIDWEQTFRFIPESEGSCEAFAENLVGTFKSSTGLNATASCFERSPIGAGDPWFSVRLKFQSPQRLPFVSLQINSEPTDLFSVSEAMYESLAACEADLVNQSAKFVAQTGLHPLVQYCYADRIALNPGDPKGSDARIFAYGSASKRPVLYGTVDGTGLTDAAISSRKSALMVLRPSYDSHVFTTSKKAGAVDKKVITNLREYRDFGDLTAWPIFRRVATWTGTTIEASIKGPGGILTGLPAVATALTENPTPPIALWSEPGPTENAIMELYAWSAYGSRAYSPGTKPDFSSCLTYLDDFTVAHPGVVLSSFCVMETGKVRPYFVCLDGDCS